MRIPTSVILCPKTLAFRSNVYQSGIRIGSRKYLNEYTPSWGADWRRTYTYYDSFYPAVWQGEWDTCVVIRIRMIMHLKGKTHLVKSINILHWQVSNPLRNYVWKFEGSTYHGSQAMTFQKFIMINFLPQFLLQNVWRALTTVTSRHCPPLPGLPGRHSLWSVKVHADFPTALSGGGGQERLYFWYISADCDAQGGGRDIKLSGILLWY